jgi:hypothetical protein
MSQLFQGPGIALNRQKKLQIIQLKLYDESSKTKKMEINFQQS